MTFCIQTHNKIADIGLKILTEQGMVLGHHKPDGILLRSQPLGVEDVPQSVAVIARAGAGTNNIPVAAMTTRGIPVLNTPGANANAVKDLVLMALLYHSRCIAEATRAMTQLDPKDQNFARTIEDIKKAFVGTEIRGKTLAIIGLGAVGVHVANAAVALGMKVMGYDPFIQLKHSWMLSAEVEHITNLTQLVAAADFISLHVPLVKQTQHLINTPLLSHCKSNAVLLNFSRAAVVDETAILSALHQQQLAHYICDFPSAPLLAQPQVTCFPHLGASTHEAEANCAVMAAQQLYRYLTEGSIVNSVNLPNLNLNPLQSPRVCIINQNIPKMVSQITEKIAAAKINVNALNNVSRDEIAYTVIDLAQALPHHVLTELQGIPGVIRVRYLTPETKLESNHERLSASLSSH